MKQVLVTGGAGFIGSNFVRYLLAKKQDVNVITLDALTYAGRRENLEALPDPGRHTFIHGDIAEQALIEQTLKEHHIDTIVNFAAETHVDRSILGAAPFLKTNVMGVFSLLEAARLVWLDLRNDREPRYRFLHVSTDEVYGSLKPNDPLSQEDSSYAPNSPYAASKAAADHLVRAYIRTYGIPAIVTNCSNNYGPFQYPEKLIPLVILNAIEGKPLPLYGDGLHIRDWIYVEDHVAAIMKVLEKGQIGETYNISGGVQKTNLEVVETICQMMDKRMPDSLATPHASLIKFVPDRPGHDRRYALDGKKILLELDWRPQWSFEQGLRESLDWYFKHPDWVQMVKAAPSYAEWMRTNYGKRRNLI